mgnify:CR=1 FL=1
MHAPVAGPANPNDSTTMPVGMRNHWGGQAEDAHLNSFTFDDQYHRFVKSGVAADPAVGTDVQGEMKHDQASQIPKKKRKTRKCQSVDVQRGTLDRPFVLRSRQPWAEKEMHEEVELTDEQKEKAASLEEKRAEKAALAGKGDYSIFHGNEAEDYQGRSWMDPPAGIRHDAGEACFLPKRLVHCWKVGINAFAIFSSSSSLLYLMRKISQWNYVLVSGSHEGSQLHSILSQIRASALVCGFGWKSQDMADGQQKGLFADLYWPLERN